MLPVMPCPSSSVWTRSVVQAATHGLLDAGVMRPLLIALAMIITMLWRSSGLWPAPDAAQELGKNQRPRKGRSRSDSPL